MVGRGIATGPDPAERDRLLPDRARLLIDRDHRVGLGDLKAQSPSFGRDRGRVLREIEADLAWRSLAELHDDPTLAAAYLGVL